MIVILLITIIFVATSAYFFLQAEKLNRNLSMLKREFANAEQEHNALSKTLVHIATTYDKFTKKRLNNISSTSEHRIDKREIELLTTFINNYRIIFNECSTGKGKLHAVTKKCFASQGADIYDEFVKKIIKSDNQIQRLWSGNNLVGFISIVESLLVKYDNE